MKKKIEYGNYKREDWHDLHGLFDPNVEEVLDCIEFMDWEGYELWAHGGILEDRITTDLDLTIIGILDVDKINFMLDTIVACGFSKGVYIDVKYLVDGDLFDHQIFLEDQQFVRNIYATYRPEIKVNSVTFTYGSKLDGLYLVEQIHPMRKVLHKSMPSPVRIY